MCHTYYRFPASLTYVASFAVKSISTKLKIIARKNKKYINIFEFSASENLKCHICFIIYKRLLLLPEVQLEPIQPALQLENPSVCRHVLQFKEHDRKQFSP